MPIYEYLCNSCGEPFEKMVSFSNSGKIQECPNCRSNETQKKISVFATGGGTQPSFSSSGSGCNSGGRFT